MNEVVERVARALCESDYGDPEALRYSGDDYSNTLQPAWHAYTEPAQMAVKIGTEAERDAVVAYLRSHEGLGDRGKWLIVAADEIERSRHLTTPL